MEPFRGKGVINCLDSLTVFPQRAMMEKFATDDELEQLSAQRRRAKQMEHKKVIPFAYPLSPTVSNPYYYYQFLIPLHTQGCRWTARRASHAFCV